MVNRQIKLYDTGTGQRLLLSRSLVGLETIEGFPEIEERFGVTLKYLEGRDSFSGSEIVVQPPVDSEKLAEFGQAIVDIAVRGDLAGGNFINFWDQRPQVPRLLATR